MAKVGEFELCNEDKVERAIHGTMARGGVLQGGLGENYTPEQLLAKYDQLGGLIMKGTLKVKCGSFYDFDKRCPRTEPEVTFMAYIDEEVMEVTEEEAESIELAKKKVADLKKKKKGEEVEEKPKKKKRLKE